MQLHKKDLLILVGKIILATGIWGVIFFYDVPMSNTPSDNSATIYHTVQTNNLEQKQSQEEINIIIDSERTTQEQEKIQQSIKIIIQQLSAILNYPQQLDTAISSIKINKSKGTSRGYSSHHNIVIYYGDMNSDEFSQVLIHEIGHVIDLGLIEGESGERNNQFSEFGEFVFAEDDRSVLFYSLSRESEQKKRNDSKSLDFCSIYGTTNPFEDFAECINLYLYHNNYFKLLSENNIILKKKYNFIASLFGNNYISGGLPFYTKSIKERYRDTTRIQE